MSKKRPIISVTGSSGAGTSTVKDTFDKIFRREGSKAVTIEGDAFHRFNRAEMRAELAKLRDANDETFSHFSYEANELGELERVFREYGRPAKAVLGTMCMMPKKQSATVCHPANSRHGPPLQRTLIFYSTRVSMAQLSMTKSTCKNMPA